MKYLISTPSQLSHALRSVRRTHGLSQDGAGKLVGLLPKTISALENHPGSATIDSLIKLLPPWSWNSCSCPKRQACP